MRADVQIRHRLRATTGSIERKAARKAERIQNSSSTGQGFDPATVFTLIQKETSFLSAHDIGLEAQTGFKKDHRLLQSRSVQNLAVNQIEIAAGGGLNVPAEPQD